VRGTNWVTQGPLSLQVINLIPGTQKNICKIVFAERMGQLQGLPPNVVLGPRELLMCNVHSQNEVILFSVFKFHCEPTVEPLNFLLYTSKVQDIYSLVKCYKSYCVWCSRILPVSVFCVLRGSGITPLKCVEIYGMVLLLISWRMRQ